MVGFTCPGDGKPLDPDHHGWLHWFNFPLPDGGRPNTDLWPDTSDYTAEELYPATGLVLPSGETPSLFSSRHPLTVQRHFHWMAMHGVDGGFLQRFAGQVDFKEGESSNMRDQRDEIGDRVREAAEKEGRVWAIMYDVSGVAGDQIQGVIERDWMHLINDKKILESPNYLHEKGKPVISLWGFAFDNANHTPSSLRALTAFLRASNPNSAYIIAGTPTHWRTSRGDADPNTEFVDVFTKDFDMISPWTVGRFGNEEEADRFAEEHIRGDMDFLKEKHESGGKKVDYMPVVLPGGSGFNLSEGHWDFNGMKRNGGKFLWTQIHNAKRLGVRVMYGAMWDEYDEGTAFMPVVQTKRQVPLPAGEGGKYKFMALDEDGYDLPSDWYMRICGFAAEGLRSERLIHETFPSKELQDYWSTRPHYEPDAASSQAQGSSSQSGGTSGKEESSEAEKKYQDWLKTQGDEKDELPPPAYSLEATSPPASAPPAQVQPAASLSRQSSANVQPVVPLHTRPSFRAPSQPSAQPPPVDPSSRPGPPIDTSTRPSPGFPSPQTPYIPVDALADDFSRHASISGRPPPPQPGGLSPHPSLSYGSRPPGVAPLSPRPPRSPAPGAGGFTLPQSPHPGPQASLYGIQQPQVGSYAPPPGPPQAGSPYGPPPGPPQPHAPYAPPPGPPQASSPYGPPQSLYNISQSPYAPPPGPPHSQYSSPPGPPQPSSYSPPLGSPQSSSPYTSSPEHSPYSPSFFPQAQHHQPYRPVPLHQQYAPPPPQQQWRPPPSQGGYIPPYRVPTDTPGFPQAGGQSPTGTPPASASPYGPPRPGGQVPSQYPGMPQAPSQPQFLDRAFGAIGSIAGDDRRRQLEQGVGKLTKSSSKIFRKFAG
ncbi:hypothetical protein HWV62_44153 [Athelia sp. TMB]|nr:hypothetical protein HWV62_44153 [Athelia sp. TMB]